MDIQVEGNNNRVAGRDYIENNLNISGEDLQKLAKILVREIEVRKMETTDAERRIAVMLAIGC